MSNINRPRTGLPKCKFCGSTDRDSNGQCHCRNTLYRLTQKVESDARRKRVKDVFNSSLEVRGGVFDVKAATAAVHEEFPSMTTRKAAPKRQTRAQKEKAVAKKIAEKPAPLPEPEQPKQKAYLLIVDDFEETGFARKDAAIKAGVRSGGSWVVRTTKSNTIVASNEDI